jgi:hypothetical protein
MKIVPRLCDCRQQSRAQAGLSKKWRRSAETRLDPLNPAAMSMDGA